MALVDAGIADLPPEERPQSPREEFANALSHGIGLAAILAATPALLAAARHHGGPGSVIGAALFAGTAALLYLASTLYHSVPANRKDFFRMLDHMAIYCLIAGTYTPFALGPLAGPQGRTLLAVVWSLALAGVFFKALARFRFPFLSTGLYIAMGWLAVFMLKPLALHMPAAGLMWLAAGGIAYTGGTVFYHWHRLRYAHLVWHCFVLAGTACHYIAILRYAM